MRNSIVFYLNGVRKEIQGAEAFQMLSDYLRYDQCLTGTKVVCAEGDCGACTVLKCFETDEKSRFNPINSCVVLVAQLDGSSLITIEGLKDNDELSEVQKKMVECHGSQCGYCTPGFVMAISGLVDKKKSNNECSISSKEAKNYLTGNLCRCTGYQPIVESMVKLDLEKAQSLSDRYLNVAERGELERVKKESVHLKIHDYEYYSPVTLNEAVKFLEINKDVTIIGAGTDLGVVHNKRKINLKKLLNLNLIKDLHEIKRDGNQITVGSRVTIDDFRVFIKNYIPEFSDYLDVFASPQIKNSATVIGNIATASPIGDTPPVFLSLDSNVHVSSVTGERNIAMSDFFLGYRKINLVPGELITKISFKIPEKNSFLKFFKISNRKDLDISAINMSFNLSFDPQDQKKIHEIKISGGGIAATPMRFIKTENYLKNKVIDKNVISAALTILHQEFTPISDLRASSAYRRIVVEKTFCRFFDEFGVRS